MEKEQLISMIHFLEERGKESELENKELKNLVTELKAARKANLDTQTKLMQRVERLTGQVADLSVQNEDLQQQVNILLSKIKS